MTLTDPRDETTYIECVYCGREHVGSDGDAVPALRDHAAWDAIAIDHAPDCEWVATRAHRQDIIRIGDWRDPATGQAYRAAYVDDLVLTGPEHAGLSDADLLAEAEAERRRGAR